MKTRPREAATVRQELVPPDIRCVRMATGKRASEVQLRLSDVLCLGDVVPRVPFAMHRVAGWPSRGST
jgi:hypothetical protein